MNNAVFGKTQENFQNWIVVEVLTDKKITKKRVGNVGFKPLVYHTPFGGPRGPADNVRWSLVGRENFTGDTLKGGQAYVGDVSSGLGKII